MKNKLILTPIVMLFSIMVWGIQKQVDSVSYYQNKINKTTNQKVLANTIKKLGAYYQNNNVIDKAFLQYKKAQSIYEKLNIQNQVANLNYSMFGLLKSQNQIEIDCIPYLNKYQDYAIKYQDTLKLINAQKAQASLNFTADKYSFAKTHYLKALHLSEKFHDTISTATIYSNLGLLYSGFISQDSARFYFDKALKLNSTNKLTLYINYANSYQRENKHIKALEYLQLAEQLPIIKYKKAYLKILHGKLANSYSKTNQFEKAFESFNLYNRYKDSINVTDQNKSIAATEEKYQNEKLRANNLEIDAQRKENRNWLIGALLLLLFTGITAYFINKNTKRKQLLAEKDKALQIQKVSTLLKEQELTSIDAMIAGQEKERQRIANDLHDDLGALMATIKLHLNAIQENNQLPLKQVNLLINEAYSKIRGMAHSRNAGVMAQDGLLKALNKVAHTINQSKQLQVNIVSYGLEDRLENSLELSIFRMIQELITNIIKHAQASEANIHLTQHEDLLNIMVEDNGIGFNTKHINKKDGMGIHSIDKRIEHLNGTIDIESAPQQGTTVIIDIPL